MHTLKNHYYYSIKVKFCYIVLTLYRIIAAATITSDDRLDYKIIYRMI